MVRGPHPGHLESPESREQTKAMEPKDSVQERDVPKLTEITKLTKVSDKYFELLIVFPAGWQLGQTKGLCPSRARQLCFGIRY